MVSAQAIHDEDDKAALAGVVAAQRSPWCYHVGGGASCHAKIIDVADGQAAGPAVAPFIAVEYPVDDRGVVYVKLVGSAGGEGENTCQRAATLALG